MSKYRFRHIEVEIERIRRLECGGGSPGPGHAPEK